MRSFRTVVALVLVSWGLGSVGPDGATMARAQGTGLVIYGTVLRPGSREPVPGARVSIARSGRGSADEEPGLATTDSEGRFLLSGLNAGRYEVSVVLQEPKAGTGMDLARAETVFLSPDDIPPNLQLWLPERGRVSGRVLGPDGEPLQDFRVSLWSLGWSGQRTLVRPVGSGEASTDEDGRYELYAPPGEYYVEATDVSSPVYPRHYYPGVLYPEDAAPVTLHAGTDVAGIDVSIRRTGLYSVRFDLGVPPPPGLTEPPAEMLRVDLVPIRAIIRPVGLGRIDIGRYPRETGLRRIDEDTWEFKELFGPGEYDLSLSYSNALSEVLWRRRFSLDPELNEFVRTRVNLDPEDADDTGTIDLGTIAVTPRVSVEGRVVVRGRDRSSVDVTRLRFNLGLTDVSSEGTFLLKDKLPGIYDFRVSPASMPDGWYVASIRSGSRDVLRNGLELSGPSVPVEIVIANGAGQIQGVTRSRAGELIPGSRIVLIPPLQVRGPRARFPTAVADSSGAYFLDRIPPGDYGLLALDEAGTVERQRVLGARSPDLYWEDPDFLREYEFRAEPVTVDPGARMVINPEAILISD